MIDFWDCIFGIANEEDRHGEKGVSGKVSSPYKDVYIWFYYSTRTIAHTHQSHSSADVSIPRHAIARLMTTHTLLPGYRSGWVPSVSAASHSQCRASA